MFTPDFPTKVNNCKSYETNPDSATKSNDISLFNTAATELTKQEIVHFPTGCKRLDNLLYGGIEAGVITQVYGGPGVGKTQFCHTLCVMLPSEHNAIYIDTEGSFRPERIETIANARGLDSKQILQKTRFTKALDSKQLELRIEAACSKIDSDNKIKLLIVDSIINHYSVEYAGRSKLPEKMQQLNKYMHLLLKTASSNGVAVVVINHQTLSSLDGFDNKVIPLGGSVISYVSKYIIRLDGRNNDRRRARLERSPSHPQSEIYFAVDERRGFTDSE